MASGWLALSFIFSWEFFFGGDELVACAGFYARSRGFADRLGFFLA